MTIGSSISKAIKEGKWLDIKYQHSDTEVTSFWISILDIDFDLKRLIVNIFNDKLT